MHPPQDTSIHFIGGGNMADALIGGLIAAGHPTARITVTEPDAQRAEALRSRHAVHVLAPGEALPERAVVVLAVKPQHIAAALTGTPVVNASAVLSIAAGVRCATLRTHLPAGAQLIRSMPNTPARLGAGITGLYADRDASDAAREGAEYVMRAAGETVWLDNEEDLDAVTALSGSGPAYVFALTEAMAAAGAALGLPVAVAQKLARHTVIGAGALLAEDDTPASTLRERVTSPGGTTAAALQQLQNGKLDNLILDAMRAAAARAAALADSSDDIPPKP